MPVSAAAAAVVSSYIGHQEEVLKAIQARGAPFLFGTDTAVGGAGWGNPPGLNGYLEMEHLARAGVPLDAIFRAATLDAATMFHLEDELGTVEAGKRANLLLLSANPLSTLAAWNSIEQVILNGRPIARDTLAADSRQHGAADSPGARQRSPGDPVASEPAEGRPHHQRDGRGPQAGGVRPSSSAPRSGAPPANPSVTFGIATPRSTAADPGFSRKSRSDAL